MAPIRRVVLRYVALQLPGWVIVSLLAWVAVRWLELPGWAGALGVAAWMTKDAVLFPYVRRAYEDGPEGDHRVSVGDRAIAVESVAPVGFVRAGSELWRAELAPGAAPIEPGASVRVCAVEGLRLVVEGAEAEATPPPLG